MKNIPEVKLGIVAVSRDCFPMSLSESRRIKVCQEYKKAYGDIYECPTVVENENDMLKALDEVNTAGCNALVVYLGNFGPESSETLLAKKFDLLCLLQQLKSHAAMSLSTTEATHTAVCSTQAITLH